MAVTGKGKGARKDANGAAKKADSKEGSEGPKQPERANDEEEKLEEFHAKPLILSLLLFVSGYVMFRLGFITHWAAAAAFVISYVPQYNSKIEQGFGCPSSWYRKFGFLTSYLSEKVGFKYVLHGCRKEDFKSVTQAIVAILPHGAGSIGHCLFGAGDTHDFWTEVLPVERRSLSASILFKIPFIRENTLALGGIDADKQVAANALRRGLSLTVVPGGVLGQALAQYGKGGVYLKNRKGFCKLAIQHGCDLIPVFVFGESLAFHEISFLRPVSRFLATNFRIGIPPAYGWCYLLPFRPPKGMVAVVGKPIKVRRVENPSAKDVEELHSKFTEALRDIFDSNKEEYGYAGEKFFDLGDEEGAVEAKPSKETKKKK